MRDANATFRIPNSEFDLGGVLLHGRGGTAQQMIELANRLDIDRVRWLAPAAEGGSWYPNRFMEPIASNEPFLSRAIDVSDQAVDAVSDGGRVGQQQLVLVGFSQGACLAVEYALRRPGRCGTVVVLTGGLIGPPATPWPTVDLRGTRVLITGSDVDEWVPESRVRETARVLERLGADVRLRIYTGRPHVVSDDEVAEARAFINLCPRPAAVTAAESNP
jgi:phospholipase/carboxylesterase